jgi:hypothetical protein
MRLVSRVVVRFRGFGPSGVVTAPFVVLAEARRRGDPFP